MKFQRIIFILFLTILTSCGVMNLLVGKIDYYVSKKTASRLNLYVKQEDKLHKDIEKLFDDIKPEVKIIENVLEEFPKKEKVISQTDINDSFLKIKPALGSAIFKASEVLALYLSMLSEKQREMFITELVEKNIKAKQALKKNKYFEKVNDRFEMLLGKLTPKQKLIIKKHRYTYQRWQEKRVKINLEFEKQLKIIFNEKEEKTRLTQLKALAKSSTDEFMASFEGVVFEEILKSYYLVVKNASKDQREVLDEKKEFILGIIRNFIKIKYSS